MSEEKHRQISKKGGEASGGNPENLENVDRSEAERTSEIGREGGGDRNE